MNGSGDRVEIVVAVLRRHGRVLLCHRSPQRAWYPNVWDLPGGHVEAGEVPERALVRELAEELGISIAQPSDGPTAVIATDEFHMQVWLVESWAGVPTNTAPDEHDQLVWANLGEAQDLELAHTDYLPLLTGLLTGPASVAR